MAAESDNARPNPSIQSAGSTVFESARIGDLYTPCIPFEIVKLPRLTQAELEMRTRPTRKRNGGVRWKSLGC